METTDTEQGRGIDAGKDSLFEAVFDSSPDGIVLVGQEGKIRRANDRMEDLFGYEPEALRGKPIEILVPEWLREEHVDMRDEFLNAPEARPMGVGLDLAGQRQDGSVFPVDVGLSPVEVGEERLVMAAVRDTTEQESLRTKYRAMLETAPDAVIVADAGTGEIVEVNDRAVELTGYTERELIGMSQAELHPAGERDRYRDLFERHLESEGIRSRLPDGSDILIERKDGSTIPVAINAGVFELGNQRLVTGSFRDITERRAREHELERAESIIQASGDAVYMLDPDGIFTFVNEALTRLSGYAREELVGEHVSLVMEPSDIERGRSLIEELLTGPKERGTFEMTIHTASGEAIPTENHIALLETDDGKLAASVGVLRDISARKERERSLRRQNERLDEFASVVSHDLRNPLTIASGHVELAQDECDSSSLERTEEALGRMDQIIEETLTLARQGAAVGETEPVDLSRMADQCWRIVQTQSATLQVEDPARIEADPDRLRHVFENLFRNAVEHGGEDVTIRVGGLDDGFYVEDDGPGIPADEREQVFDAGRSSLADGTGFGLAIVKQIVEAHDWQVAICEGTDGGARFEITGVR